MFFSDVAAGAETVEDLAVEIVVGEDLVVEDEAEPDPEIGGEKKESQKRRKRVEGANLLRTVLLKQLRLKGTMAPMELMVGRWLIRKNPVPRAAPAGDLGVETDVAQGLATDADQDPDPGRDPSDLGRERGGAGLAVGTEGRVEAAPDGPDPEITKARRAKETAELRKGKTRSLASRETMIKKKPDMRIRRTRSTKLSTWRSRILPKYFISLSRVQF